MEIDALGERRQRGARRRVEPRNAQAGAELHLGDAHAGVRRQRDDLRRLLELDRRVADVDAQAEVTAQHGLHAGRRDADEPRHLRTQRRRQQPLLEERHRFGGGLEDARRLGLERQGDGAAGRLAQPMQGRDVDRQMAGHRRQVGLGAHRRAEGARHRADASLQAGSSGRSRVRIRARRSL